MRAVFALVAFGAKLIANFQFIKRAFLRVAELNGVGRVTTYLNFVSDGNDDRLRPFGGARRDCDLFRLRVERRDNAGEAALPPLGALFILLLGNLRLADDG